MIRSSISSNFLPGRNGKVMNGTGQYGVTDDKLKYEHVSTKPSDDKLRVPIGDEQRPTDDRYGHEYIGWI